MSQHPEDFCERCNRPNLPAWWIDSALWNATLRGPDGSDEWDVLCPQCFVELAEAKGIVTRPIWELRLDGPLSITRVKATTPDGEPFSGDEQYLAAGAVLLAVGEWADADAFGSDPEAMENALLAAWDAYRAATTPEPVEPEGESDA